MNELKVRLDNLIVEKDFNLQDPEVQKLSRKLDKEVAKKQKQAVRQHNLRKNSVITF